MSVTDGGVAVRACVCVCVYKFYRMNCMVYLMGSYKLTTIALASLTMRRARRQVRGRREQRVFSANFGGIERGGMRRGVGAERGNCGVSAVGMECGGPGDPVRVIFEGHI